MHKLDSRGTVYNVRVCFIVVEIWDIQDYG
jgi:hypothetical protein